MLVLGIIAAGGIFAGTNPAYTQYELVHHIKTSKTRFLISEPEILDAIVAAAKECDIPTSNIWIFDILGQAVPRGFRSWNELLQYGEEDWERFDDLETAKNTTATRLFSSGTTGLPKAAELSHYNIIAQHVMVYEARERSYDVSLFLSASNTGVSYFRIDQTPLRNPHVPRSSSSLCTLLRS
jgi:acyl-CoA synthetase (AMP-forming)/AMP-acid ligase II